MKRTSSLLVGVACLILAIIFASSVVFLNPSPSLRFFLDGIAIMLLILTFIILIRARLSRR